MTKKNREILFFNRPKPQIYKYDLGKDSPALGLHEEIRLLEKSLDELRSRLAESHAARDRLEALSIESENHVSGDLYL